MRIPRLIPATLTVASLLLVVKLVDVSRGTEELSRSLLIPPVEAQAEPAKPEEAAKKTEEKKTDEEVKPEKKEEEKKPEEKSSEGKKEGETHGEGEKEKKEACNAKVSANVGETADRGYSKVEMELLQSLSKRREDLDRWEQNIQIKESTLGATEKRIEEKILQIQAMKKEVAELLSQYNTQEDAKIKGLVRIYENMKSKDAARIFDEVEMPILLLVLGKMAEKKAAPILAEMNPSKAKQITVQLAEQHRVNQSKFNQLIQAQPKKE